VVLLSRTIQLLVQMTPLGLNYHVSFRPGRFCGNTYCGSQQFFSLVLGEELTRGKGGSESISAIRSKLEQQNE